MNDPLFPDPTDIPFGPGHPQYCPNSKDEDNFGSHCIHWWDCEACCWCGDDMIDLTCDCPRHMAMRHTFLAFMLQQLLPPDEELYP